ncbi:MAG: PAS domain S-box protein [Pirellulaceae bacterium]|nr:PAS domain S-box protein [Pirellulaceae bacterium]
MDQTVPEARPGKPREWGPSFHVVGVGASAGGLEALEKFFDNMRPDSGLAFVVIQHLSPDFKSLMDELLRRHTDIAIHRVEDGMQVEPNSIYLIPPKKEMIISGGRLLLTDKDPTQGLSLPIDTFFRSLAQDAGDLAIGIVLSGTGSDGSRGIREIHEAGGLVLVQSVETAKFDGMPRSAIDTGMVDAVMAPEQIPAALLNYVGQPRGVRWSHADGADLTNQDAMQTVIKLLREQYGIDFSYYKPNTVTRRIERRLLLNQTLDLDAYAERLSHDPAELSALYKDLLIGVTKFFRDREAFERLEKEVVANILNRRNPQDEIRVWVAGCATGEEAYSVAMALHSHFEEVGRQQNIKIFATDVHRASLELASAGIYDESALSEVTPTRLERYFARHGNSFQVVPELRRLIVFAPHNVIKDAPFTKMDLITCRNLLIYFSAPAQKKVLSLFLFGLKTRGLLFLGPSESPGDLASEFDTLDNQWKLYRKRRDVGLPADMRFPLSSGFIAPGAVGARSSLELPRPKDSTLNRVYDVLLKKHMPPSLLVNERLELVHSFGQAGRYLIIRDGRHTVDVLDLLHEDLRTPLAGALQRAATHKQAVVYKGVRVRLAEMDEQLNITVEPLLDDTTGVHYSLVTLESTSAKAATAPRIDELDLGQASREHLESLEVELRYTKENLQATIEELETSNEELQATNEELVASNEELQSTNEELHSVNEELYTVNAEYQRKIAELEQMTADMDSLLHSTEIGVMFLDRDLCIRKFTSMIGRFFDLLPHDVGRRISTFTHSIVHEGLVHEIRTVLETQNVYQCEVQDVRGVWYLLRVLPYLGNRQASGVVVTIVDVSVLKQTEGQLLRMSKVFMDGADPIIIEDLNGRIVDVNNEAERIYGWKREELLGQSVDLLVPASRREASRQLRARCRKQEHVRNIETVRQSKSGDKLPVLLTLSLLTAKDGNPVAIASIAKDIKRLKDAEREARDAVRRRDHFLAMLSHELRNPLAAVMNASRLLDRAGEGDPELLQQACRVIQRQGGQMARLLDDLLDVSRVTQGKIRLRTSVCDLTRMVDDAAESVRPQIEQRRHELEVELRDRPLYVRGDCSRLLQIQANLLSNAVKYTPPGGKIRLVLEREGSQAVLRVRDNGRGIPAEMLTSIFDLFIQTDDPVHRDEGGMGVGLTLVQQLVELHGGTVQAFSDGPEQGSEFVVRLPLTDERPAASKSRGVTNAVGPRRVLIVEDERDNREMLRQLLELDGHQVMTANDGPGGLQAIAELRPDVALIDLRLPGLNGHEVARLARADDRCRGVRLIALTGYGRAEDRQAVLEAGFDEHLVKPVNPDDLSRAITHQVV